MREARLQRAPALPQEEEAALRDVGEVQGGRRGEDVVEVLGSGLFEAVEGGAREVPRQRLLLLARPSPRQLHHRMFGQHHSDHVTVETLAVQMTHGCWGGEFAAQEAGQFRPRRKQRRALRVGTPPDRAEPAWRRSSGPARSPSC